MNLEENAINKLEQYLHSGASSVFLTVVYFFYIEKIVDSAHF
jgi:hypothetical protein